MVFLGSYFAKGKTGGKLCLGDDRSAESPEINGDLRLHSQMLVYSHKAPALEKDLVEHVKLYNVIFLRLL